MKEGRGHRGGKPTLQYNPKARLDRSQVQLYGKGPTRGVAYAVKDPAAPKVSGPKPKPKRK